MYALIANRRSVSIAPVSARWSAATRRWSTAICTFRSSTWACTSLKRLTSACSCAPSAASCFSSCAMSVLSEPTLAPAFAGDATTAAVTMPITLNVANEVRA